MTQYADLHSFSQTQRIKMIGETVTKSRKLIGAIIDDDKVNLYIKTVLKNWPEVICIKKLPFAPGSQFVQFGPKPITPPCPNPTSS